MARRPASVLCLTQRTMSDKLRSCGCWSNVLTLPPDSPYASRNMTLRKNNLVTAASPSAGSRGIGLSSASPLANSLAFSSPSSREARSPVSSARMSHSQVESRSTSDRLTALEERAENVRQNMHVVERQRDQALMELAAVKKELGRVMAELKGFYAREAGRMDDMRVLKESNRKLQEEVKRLDAVALDLENELSAAEIKLEKYDSGQLQSSKVLENTRELEGRLREKETDLEAREWRIDDLMHQVSVLKDCVLEYQGRMIDAERASASLSQALQETEQSYYSVVQSSMASLQSMDTRLSELKQAVASREASNSVRPAAGRSFGDGRDDGRSGELGATDVHAVTPESMGYSANRRGGQEDVARDALRASLDSLKSLESLKSMDGRLKELERAYGSTLARCEELTTENASLREMIEKMEKMESLKQNEFRQSTEEARIELTSALERIEDEAAAKVEEAVDALSKEHEREMELLEKDHKHAISGVEKAKDAEIDRLREETKSLERALQKSNATASQSQAENKRLIREKEALCAAMEELKLALTKQVGAAVGGLESNNVNKENSAIVNLANNKSGKQGLIDSIRGTPLRSLGNAKI